MLDDIWKFVLDPNHRSIVSWSAGGAVAIGGGILGVLKYVRRNKAKSDDSHIYAKNNSIVVTGSIKNADIKIQDKESRKI